MSTPLSSQEREALQWLKTYLSRALGDRVKTIRLFGSRARGEGHPASDLDVAMIVDRADDRAESIAWDAMVEIMGRYDVACEMIVLGVEEYADALARQRPFELNVERDGVVL